MKNTLLIIAIMMPILLFAQQNAERYGACMMRDSTTIGIHENEIFAMHSVMKFPQALYVADYLNRKGIELSETIVVTRSELEQGTWSPMLKTIEREKEFSYSELLELSLAQSDNNACDLLFKHCGSPKAVEKYLRKLGFNDIHIRKTEKQLHRNPSDAIKNNCTPIEMANLFKWFSNHKNDNQYLRFIWSTMANCSTGQKRIPAALPEGAIAVHKTGTGFPSPEGTQDMNDAGIIIMPDGNQSYIAIFTTNARTEEELANIARQLLFGER